MKSTQSLPRRGNVYTIVLTMSKYIATVIKTGNSYALRVPIDVVRSEDLKLGEKVAIGGIYKNRPQDQDKIAALVKELQTLPATPGSLKSIKDPVVWQREMRTDRSLPGRD